MSNQRSLSTSALPAAHAVLRILVILNWLYGAGILALLIISIANGTWFLSAMKLSGSAAGVLIGFRAIMTVGLLTVPLHYVLLKRLLEIVDTVRSGDPFVSENAQRLRSIGWVLVALNLLSIIIGAVGAYVSTDASPVHLDAGFSINGWLAVLLTFILARVFAEGSLMRADLEGTV
jgi:hypothetical protein